MFCALHIPDFPAAAVIRAEPDLRPHPVAVLDGTPPLLRVVAMNELARCQGVELAMMKIEAEAPTGLSLRRRSPLEEASAEAALLDCAHAFSPRVEPIAPDTMLLDAAGLERLFGTPAQLAQQIAARAAALGLDPNIAIARNREAAIHAARGFPGTTLIADGEEARRLGELPIDVLFSGPDAAGASAQKRRDADKSQAQKTKGRNFSKPREYREAPSFDVQRDTTAPAGAQFFIETLDRWGVHTLRGFAALPTVAVAERLGQEGVRLQKMARGEGSAELVAAEPPLRFVESMELEHPVELLEPLAFILARLLEQLCARLSARALATNELRLALTLDTAVRDEEIESPPRRHEDTKDSDVVITSACSARGIYFSAASGTADASEAPPPRHDNSKNDSDFVPSCLRGELFSRTLRLPTPMLDARLFLKLLQLDLKQHPPQAPVLKVELAAEPVKPQIAQHGLFQTASPEPEKLHLMLARLAGIVGEGNAGSPELFDTNRRDAFAMRAFQTESSPPRHRGTEKNRVVAAPPRDDDSSSVSRCLGGESPSLGLRLFRPPLAAQVTVRDNMPARVACAGDGSRAPLAGDVSWASGPWRASGDWWTQPPAPKHDAAETRYLREEWDVAIAAAEGGVLCRLVHDLEEGCWLLEGVYD